MSKAGLYDYYKGLPPWAKGVTIVATLGVVVLIGSKVYAKVFPSDAVKANKALLAGVNTEISKATAKGQQPSFTPTQYTTFANEIYEGMRYCIGDDYDTVQADLKKMKNDVDVLNLIKAFSSRQNYCFGLPTGDPKDLFTFVKSELGNEFAGLTDYRVKDINADWKTKGITYQI